MLHRLPRKVPFPASLWKGPVLCLECIFLASLPSESLLDLDLQTLVQSSEPLCRLLCLHLPPPQFYELTSLFSLQHPLPLVIFECELPKETHHGLVTFMSPAPGVWRARSRVRQRCAGKQFVLCNLHRTTFTSADRQFSLVSSYLLILLPKLHLHFVSYTA